MKVRVERIRRGRRTPEVEYVEANRPRRRVAPGPGDFERSDDHAHERVRQGPRLRLPWRINVDPH